MTIRTLLLLSALPSITASGVPSFAAMRATQASAADERVSVTGRVIVAGLEDPVPGALLTVDGQEVVTGPDGAFTFTLGPGTWSIGVAAAGFLSDTVRITIGNEAIGNLEVLLAEARFAETVEVEVQEDRPAGPAPIPVRPEAVLAQAGVADNVFRSLQTMAGVAAANDFESRISVRGGGPDQNLTVMDGVEIHNPYRLFGLTSAFNPQIVDDFELATGAFDVRHGDRLSSLLIVDNRFGTEARRFGGSAAMSITDANFVFEGRTPGQKAGSWLITGRRTYYDLVAERIVGDDLPSFADLQAKVSRELRAGQRLSFTGLISRESTDANFEDDSSGDSGAILTNAKNDLAALTFDTPLGVGGSSRTIASYYRFVDALDFDGVLESDNRVSNTGDASTRLGFIEVIFRREVEVRDLALRQEFLKSAGDRHLLDFGAELHSLETRWGWEIPGERNPNVGNGSSLQGGTGLPDLLDSRVDSTRVGAWLADRFQATSRLVLEPGARVDYSTINKKTIVSPRLAAMLELNPSTRLRGAVGLHSQSPGYEKLFQADYFVDLTDAAGGLESERSTHFILGIERDLGAGVKGRLEGFYKDFSDLIVGRLETEAERLARVSRYDFPSELQSSVPTEAEITSFPSNGSSGRAYGFDVYLAKRPTASSSRLGGWLAYTLTTADREAYGRNYPFDYDRRHSLNVVGSYRIGDRFDGAVTGRFASGFPFTPARGVRAVATEDPENPERLIPSTDEAGNLVWSIDPGGASNLNSGRFPHYARVDARVTFRPRGSKGRWEFYLEAINLLNRKNDAQVDYRIDFDSVTGEPLLSEGQNDGGIPFLPTFGVRFRF